MPYCDYIKREKWKERTPAFCLNTDLSLIISTGPTAVGQVATRCQLCSSNIPHMRSVSHCYSRWHGLFQGHLPFLQWQFITTKCAPVILNLRLNCGQKSSILCHCVQPRHRTGSCILIIFLTENVINIAGRADKMHPALYKGKQVLRYFQ